MDSDPGFNGSHTGCSRVGIVPLHPYVCAGMQALAGTESGEKTSRNIDKSQDVKL